MAKAEVLAGGEGRFVSADAEMPPIEPGHHEINPDAFDPNAAYRFAHGSPVGLQDSEQINPAFWVMGEDHARAFAEKAVKQAEAALEAAKADLKAVRGEDAPKSASKPTV